MNRRWRFVVGVGVVSLGLLVQVGCTRSSAAPEAGPTVRAPLKLEVTSTALREGAPIPQEYACADYDHLGKSPPLAWSKGPEGTAAYAVTVVDPDAKNFAHWALIGVPPNTTSLPAGVSPGGRLPEGAIELINDFDKQGYGGPCPPKGAPRHRYEYRVTAVKTKDLPRGKPDAAFFEALDEAALATGSITVTYQR